MASPDLLRIGPYQGTLGCLDIAFGRGVCGTAAAERRTIIVADVAKFPVTSVVMRAQSRRSSFRCLNPQGALIAALDVDSDKRGRFDEEDARGLERIVRWFAGEGRG